MEAVPVTDFLETPRFDENISYGSSGGPAFKTTVFEGHSGVEQRSINWSRAKGQWNVAQGIRDKSDMDSIRAFFVNVKGRAIGFRFKDWGDYELVDSNIGTGDGIETTFLLTKTYTVGALSYVRRIFKPVSGTLVVKVDGVTVPIGAGSTEVAVDYTTGTLVFGADVIPADTKPVTVSGEFDTPVRFDTDQLSASHEGFIVESWTSIPLVEILLEDA